MMTFTFRLLTIMLLGTILLSNTMPASAGGGRDGSAAFDEVDAYIQETMRRLPIAGLSLAIVKGDEILYLRGYGTANRAGDPVTPQTPFMLASVTKTFTALAIQQLAARGKLHLDDPVQDYIPQLQLADENAAAAMTVRHLLEHTSGISKLEGTEPYLHSAETTFEEALNQLAQYHPIYAPGEHYEYSNWNYVLLGEVVAQASGQPYTEYMQANVLDPLEMRHASFMDYHQLPGAATGNLIVFGARLPYDEKHIPVMLSAGYLTASAEDMAHYLIPFFNQGQYGGRSLLPAQAQGWYDMAWNWLPGRPGDIGYNFSGAHNSVNTSIQLFSRHEVAVAVLMNTRLDALLPGPTAGDIAFNIGRIVIDYPYELPSNQGFYGSYALLDGFLLLLCVSLAWQISRYRGWMEDYQTAGTAKRVNAWLGVVIDLLVSVGILVLPSLLGTRWHIVLYHRPETALPLLVLSLSLGLLGLLKVIRRNQPLKRLVTPQTAT